MLRASTSRLQSPVGSAGPGKSVSAGIEQHRLPAREYSCTSGSGPASSAREPILRAVRFLLSWLRCSTVRRLGGDPFPPPVTAF
jgi:hypothetical protein